MEACDIVGEPSRAREQDDFAGALLQEPRCRHHAEAAEAPADNVSLVWAAQAWASRKCKRRQGLMAELEQRSGRGKAAMRQGHLQRVVLATGVRCQTLAKGACVTDAPC